MDRCLARAKRDIEIWLAARPPPLSRRDNGKSVCVFEGLVTGEGRGRVLAVVRKTAMALGGVIGSR